MVGNMEHKLGILLDHISTTRLFGVSLLFNLLFSFKCFVVHSLSFCISICINDRTEYLCLWPDSGIILDRIHKDLSFIFQLIYRFRLTYFVCLAHRIETCSRRYQKCI